MTHFAKYITRDIYSYISDIPVLKYFHPGNNNLAFITKTFRVKSSKYDDNLEAAVS